MYSPINLPYPINALEPYIDGQTMTKANGRCGVTPFVTESGDTDLLLVDYSEFDNLTDKEICVELFDKDVKDISCISRPDITIEKYFDGASLSEFKITIKHHEALLFRVSE